MKLFYTKRSPYARKVRVAALEKGILLELAETDLAHKPKELLDANPVGKIPALVLDDGRTFNDSPVICEYIDSLNDRPVLIPRDGAERLKVMNLAAIADGLMDITVAVYLEKTRHKEGPNQAFIKSQEEAIGRCLGYFEGHIGLFSSLSMASIALACAVGYIEFRLPHLAPGKGYLQLSAWLKDFAQRPSMTATAPVA